MSGNDEETQGGMSPTGGLRRAAAQDQTEHQKALAEALRGQEAPPSKAPRGHLEFEGEEQDQSPPEIFQNIETHPDLHRTALDDCALITPYETEVKEYDPFQPPAEVLQFERCDEP